MSNKVTKRHDGFKNLLNKDLIDWLLQGEPWVRYRTLKDILGKHKNDEKVLATKRIILEYELIKEIFDKRNKDGYWGKPTDIHTW